jgi:hypothetical protein
VRESGRLAFCAGVAAKVARFSLTICHGGKKGGRRVNAASASEISATSSLARPIALREVGVLIVTSRLETQLVRLALTTRDLRRQAARSEMELKPRIRLASSGGRSSFAIHGTRMRDRPPAPAGRSKSGETARSPSKRTARAFAAPNWEPSRGEGQRRVDEAVAGRRGRRAGGEPFPRRRSRATKRLSAPGPFRRIGVQRGGEQKTKEDP